MILVSVLETGLPGIAQMCRRERPSLLDLLSEFGLISDGWLGCISHLGDWVNALECWRSSSLRLVIPGIAVSPGVTHSDIHHLWHGTFVSLLFHLNLSVNLNNLFQVVFHSSLHWHQPPSTRFFYCFVRGSFALSLWTSLICYTILY